MNSKLITTAVEFEVKDRLVVADPCYVSQNDGPVESNCLLTGDNPIGCVIEDCEGVWRGEIVTQDEGDWGIRVSILRLIHTKRKKATSFRLIGDNGVDSGQMYAGAAEDTPLDYEALLAAYGDDWGQEILAFGGGVVSSTGYGDGCYPVYVANNTSDKPAVIEVRFMEDDE